MDGYARAIEENTNSIAELITGNLTLIANDLKSEQLIGDEDYDRIVNTPANPPLQRANDLLQRVITNVKTAPMLYEVFYSVLEKHCNLQALTEILPKPDGKSVQAHTAWCGTRVYISYSLVPRPIWKIGEKGLVSTIRAYT